jgi:hypothetical protein
MYICELLFLFLEKNENGFWYSFKNAHLTIFIHFNEITLFVVFNQNFSFGSFVLTVRSLYKCFMIFWLENGE